MKKLLFIFLVFSLIISCKKEIKSYDLTNTDKIYLNKAIDSMYELDQDVRHGFGKIDSIFGVQENFLFEIKSKRIEILGDRFESYEAKVDSIWDVLKKNDSLNTKKLIQITKQYGFPNNKRLGVYKSKAYMIFVHSPQNYFDEIRTLINQEYNAARISEYKKEYIFWHLNGKKGMPPMSGENGEAIWN